MAAEGQSDTAVSDTGVQTKQRCGIEFLINPHLLRVSGDQRVDVSTERGGWCISALVTVVASSDAGFVMCSMHLLFTAGENAQLMMVTVEK